MHPPRRPLVGLFLVVVAGLMVQSTAPTVSPVLWLGAGATLLVAGMVPALAPARTALVYAAAFLWACAHGAISRDPPEPSFLSRWMHQSAEHLAIIGRIADAPIRDSGSDADSQFWRFPVDVEKVRRAIAWTRASGRVYVLVEAKDAGFSPGFGERWLLQGVIRRGPPGVVSPPRLSMRTDAGSARRLAPARAWDLRAACFRARDVLSARLAVGVDHAPDAVALIRALLFGLRHEVPPRVVEAFATSGTLHIMAISGAHVGMISLLLLTAVRATGLSKPYWIYAMAPALVGYAMVTGLPPSAVRATVMALIVFLADAVRRQPDAQSALALAGLGILAVSPSQLERPGFILSFAAAAGLILMAPRIRDALARRLFPPDEYALPRHGASEGVRMAVLDFVAANLAAWLVTTPLAASLFSLISPVGLLANLIVLPLAFLTLFAASLSMVIGWIHPALLEVTNHAAVVFADWLIWLVEMSANVPHGHMRVASPPAAVAAGCTILIVCAICGGRVMRAASLLLLLAGLLAWGWHGATSFSIAAKNFGAAMPLLVTAPRGHWLVDPGPAFSAPRVIRFLRERGVDRLEAIVLTRATMEAGGATPLIAAAIPVRQLWVPGTRWRSRPFHQMVLGAASQSISVVPLNRGMSIQQGGVFWEVLHPPKSFSAPNAAAGGLVLRVAWGRCAAMFTPGSDPKLDLLLAALETDLGGQALIQSGRLRTTGGGPIGWQPEILLRAELPGEFWRGGDTGIMASVAFGETAVLSPAGISFRLHRIRPPDTDDY
ncbi:MAG: ComEC/Rec2 family competence protein [Kiritimatiellae bacterium]|nr:ComEC/Rec2 family competence protein [Kiritimatiellia bacterium]MDW8458930.1 ComEC/Rec2 family competence protein [Verrucomicrobiota bacterium]